MQHSWPPDHQTTILRSPSTEHQELEVGRPEKWRENSHSWVVPRYPNSLPHFLNTTRALLSQNLTFINSRVYLRAQFIPSAQMLSWPLRLQWARVFWLTSGSKNRTCFPLAAGRRAIFSFYCRRSSSSERCKYRPWSDPLLYFLLRFLTSTSSCTIMIHGGPARFWRLEVS